MEAMNRKNRTLVIEIAEAADVIVPVHEIYGPIQKECKETAVAALLPTTLLSYRIYMTTMEVPAQFHY